jgi:hypothetical protein
MVGADTMTPTGSLTDQVFHLSDVLEFEVVDQATAGSQLEALKLELAAAPTWSCETVELVVVSRAEVVRSLRADWRRLVVGDALYRYAPGYVGNRFDVQRATVRAVVDDGVVLLRWWSRGRQRWEYEAVRGDLLHIRWRVTRDEALADAAV